MQKFFDKYRSFIFYMIFGLLTTGINIVVFGICSGCGMSTAYSNIIAWIMAVLFAYITNRRWVFASENHTKVSVLKEFLTFILSRVGTGIVDQIIMVVGVDHIGARYIQPDLQFVWSILVKAGSNILVIVLNYVFSKLFVFNNKEKKS